MKEGSGEEFIIWEWKEIGLFLWGKKMKNLKGGILQKYHTFIILGILQTGGRVFPLWIQIHFNQLNANSFHKNNYYSKECHENIKNF